MDKSASEPTAFARELADARLVQDYLVAAGLVTDSALEDAIHAAENAVELPARSSSRAKLRIELSRSLSVAKPYMSLLDLRAGKSPFAPGASRRQTLRQVTVSLCSVLLICVVVIAFVITQDVSRNLSELQRVQTQNPLQKLNDLRKLVYYEHALDDKKSASYAQYQRLAQETNLLFDTAFEITTRKLPDTTESDGLLHKIY